VACRHLGAYSRSWVGGGDLAVDPVNRVRSRPACRLSH
jgi:hypothetical protein